MKKLTLDLDTLAVQSFETTAGEDGRGTVQGLMYALALGSGGASCPTCEPIETCTCAENGCGGDQTVVVVEPALPVVKTNDSMAPGCTTVYTGCGEGLAYAAYDPAFRA